ncbi:MAG: hypothetical protein WCA22_15985 [Candidatus Binatus sp.]
MRRSRRVATLRAEDSMSAGATTPIPEGKYARTDGGLSLRWTPNRCVGY